MVPEVDEFIASQDIWKDAFIKLRALCNEADLEEALKWGVPSYALKGKNVALIHGFKEYCAILFVKGALMSDPQSLLVQQTANVQASRQLRFRSAREVTEQSSIIAAYLAEARQIEADGKTVEYRKTDEFPVAEEFQARLDADAALRDAFQALTPGRQRGYLLHFSSAKQSATREKRIDACIPLIFDGLGLNDRSRK